MNKMWINFLLALDEWMCRRLQAAYRREKVRWFKRELRRQDIWKN